MRRWIWLCFLFISVCLTGYAQEVREIHVESAGNLVNVLPKGTEIDAGVTLKITGQLGNVDFDVFKELKYNGKFSLDLSEVDVETIPLGAFSSVYDFKGPLDKIALPSSLKNIENNAFANSRTLSEVDLSRCSNLCHIGSGALSCCISLQSVDFSKCRALEYVGGQEDHYNSGDLTADICWGSGINKVVLPPSLKGLFLNSFCSCENMREIEIPASLKQINGHMSGGVFTITKIKMKPENPPTIFYSGKWPTTQFSDKIYQNCVIEVPDGSLSKYKAVEPWSKFATVRYALGTYTVKVDYNEGGIVKIGEELITSGSCKSVTASEDVTVSIIPTAGYHVKSVKLGKTDVTSSVKNDQYIIQSISSNQELTIVFEKDAPVTYTVKVAYNEGGTVKIENELVESGSSKMVSALTNITVSIVPNTGYHIKSVHLNKKDVTDKIENNKIIITSIDADQELAVVFEADTPKTYLVKVTYNVGGQVKINNKAVTNGSSTSVTAGTDIQILMLPNDGHLLKQVKLGAADVTDQIVNNTLTIPEIAGDREVTVVFEKGTPATCSVKVSYSDGGMVKVNNHFVDNGISLTVQKLAKVSVAFIPDYGCYLKQVLLDGKDVTLKVGIDGLLEVESVTNDLVIVAIFEKIPLVSCIVDVTGNGTVKVNGQAISQSLDAVSVEKGSAVVLSFTPDVKYKLGSVLLNNQNITGQLKNNEYRIASLTSDIICQVEFVLIDTSTSIDPVESAIPRVYRSAPRRLAIFGFEVGVPVYVYDGSGRLVALKTIRNSMEEVEVPVDGLYFVRIGKDSFKVVL